jgi:cytochrome c oxidase subunit 2
MKHLRLSKWIWLAAVSMAAFMLPAQVARAHGPSDGGAARGDINGLFTIIFWIAVPIFFLIEGLILFAIFRYRRRRASEMPEQVEGNRTLEIAWTTLSFVIVGVLFILTYHFMTTKYKATADDDTGTPDLTVHVTAYMFDWDYEYFRGEDEETGVKTTHRVTIPTDRLVLLEITSRDVQHSFWVPDLAGKVDAVPGITNSMWLEVDKPGLYNGNCAEYCGTMHHDMVIEVEALEPDAFDQWLQAQETAASVFQPVGTDMVSELPEGSAERGEAQFEQLGCSSCHGAQAGVGPALSQIREDMNRDEGYTADTYLRESILLPCEYEVEGYNCHVMPSNYGEKLDVQMLADLIEYLKED